MSALAIHGGQPVRKTPYPVYVPIGDEEKHAVLEVLDTKVLSQFLGTWSPDFLGGPRVQGLERAWADYFGTRHAVSVNSATSGLFAAVGAAGVGPGDEVIVSPYTMSASATAALVYGAIPVFADIDPETFCLSPASIRQRIMPRTRAIIAVDIFGHPAAFDEIMAIASEHQLTVIEDAAQAPGARLGSRYAGTLGHLGVFSLNYHKTIHCGEGGVIVTDDDSLAERLQLIRNHAEVVVRAKGVTNLVNMVGFNYRMTEIEAAIAAEQLKKLERLLQPRIAAAGYLTERLAPLPGIATPVVRPGVRHGFYVYAIRYDAASTGIPRDRFARALQAEGVPISQGYVRPLYLEPLYQQRIAFGRDGFPFTYEGYTGHVSYEPGICPVTERMHSEELLYTNICHANITRADLDDFVAAFEKVLAHASELRADAAPASLVAAS
jgi:dTDP-4-amino-4,6-dideoxygalactose transaminase